MADPSFNLKTGADSQLYYSREVTSGDNKDKIKSKDGAYTYPCLTRQTGNSIKGSTESIESNELRKGRTRSAPRKGSSSAEGSLDFESSPLTFDDFMEAAFRGEWKVWWGDKNTGNKALKEAVDKSTRNFEASDLCIATKCAYEIDNQKGVGFGKKKLFRFSGTNGYNDKTQSWNSGTDSSGLFQIPAGSIVHELNCGTKDIKYMLLREFGGVETENLYQKFEHMAVSTVSNSISVGSIITGSVSFMGANDPKLFDTDETKKMFGEYEFTGTTAPGSVSGAKSGSVYYDSTNKKFYKANKDSPDETTDWTEVTASYSNPEDIFETVSGACEFIEKLPQTATQTDQFTAREGFLYLNGKNIEFANAMDWSLDNGLQKNFAIFVRNAISTEPLTLDIQGNITTYLIKGYSEKIFNSAVDDEDNEILWCTEDNEDDPKYLYIFQIFKAKFTDHDASVGSADALNISYPFSSFGEMAMRVFRVTLPGVTEVSASSSTGIKAKFDINLDSSVTRFSVKYKIGSNEEKNAKNPTINSDGELVAGYVDDESAATAGSDVVITISYQTESNNNDSKAVVYTGKVKIA